MIWDPKLETGVTQIDDQHKELFRRVGDLLRAGLNGQGSTKLGETLAFLGEYVVQHFSDEEALMDQCQYPQALTHKLQHQNYLHTYQNMVRHFENEGETLNMTVTVNRNVVDWLVTHINVHDREFARYFKEQRA